MVRLVAMLFSVAVILCAEDWPLERLLTRPYVWGTWPSQIAWAKHAHVLGFLWNADGGAFRDLYVYDADKKALTRLTDLERSKDPSNETEAERDVHRKDYVPLRGGIASFDLAQDGSKVVFSYRGDLYTETTQARSLVRLTKTRAPESNPQFSPDGTK